MKHHDIKKLVPLYLDGLLDDKQTELVENHLAGCRECQREFEEHGLNPRLAQCNISFNKDQGTLRGMHYQAAPFEHCLNRRGSFCDGCADRPIVAADL